MLYKAARMSSAASAGVPRDPLQAELGACVSLSKSMVPLHIKISDSISVALLAAVHAALV